LTYPSGRTVALALTQSVTEMGSKGGWCVGLTHLHVPIFLKNGSLNLLEPSEPDQACNGFA